MIICVGGAVTIQKISDVTCGTPVHCQRARSDRNMLNLIMQICGDGIGFRKFSRLPSDIPLSLHLLAFPLRALRKRPRQRAQRVERPQAGMAQARQGIAETQGWLVGGGSYCPQYGTHGTSWKFIYQPPL